MPCFYTILHLFKQQSKIERLIQEFSEINLRKIWENPNIWFPWQKCNSEIISASSKAKSKIERKFQEYSQKTSKFERIPRELWEKSERTLKFDFLAKMPCFYTIQHLFKQKSKIEREFQEFSEINLSKAFLARKWSPRVLSDFSQSSLGIFSNFNVFSECSWNFLSILDFAWIGAELHFWIAFLARKSDFRILRFISENSQF